MFFRLMAVVVLLGMVATGCEARLQDNRTVEVTAANDTAFTVDAKGSERTVEVSAKSHEGPINVFVYLTKHDSDNRMQEDLATAPEELFLARALDTTSAEFSVVVPANEELLVVLATVRTPSETVDLSISD